MRKAKFSWKPSMLLQVQGFVVEPLLYEGGGVATLCGAGHNWSSSIMQGGVGKHVGRGRSAIYQFIFVTCAVIFCAGYDLNDPTENSEYLNWTRSKRFDLSKKNIHSVLFPNQSQTEAKGIRSEIRLMHTR